MQRTNLIQGTTFGYTGWVPVARDGRNPCVRPLLYRQIFAADAIGHPPEIQVYPLPASTEKFATHAIYQTRTLAKYVLINFDEWNSTSSYPRSRQPISLAVPEGLSDICVERLTASGASADEGVQWVGVS